MQDLCVLFHYHRVDSLTLQHFQLLQHHNPDALIIPVTNDIADTLPGSVDVKHFTSPWETANKWRSLDTTFYLWFLNRQVSARRYVLLEYDCRCTMPLAEGYAAVWEAEVSCRSFYTPVTKPHWAWFKSEELKRLDPVDRPYAAGVVPYACTLLSHAAAERILATVTTRDVFCELRLGTAIRKAGLTVTPFPDALKNTIYASTTPFDLTQPGIYHPVKPKAVYERKLKQKLRQQQPQWLNWVRRSLRQ